MYRILIVEDDIDIGNVLEKALYQEGYAVTRAYSGTEAKLLADRQFDLILLDLMLPGLQGEELLSVFSDTKVIVLSAKADLDNKVHLLLNGAIDYISKPFYLKEAVARVKVALRKNSGVDTTFLTYKELKLNKENHTFFVNDHEVKLTKTEFAIVRVLMQYPERVYSKSSIVDLIVDETNDGVESSLNVHISNICNKINLYAHENYIETIWGLGYKLQK